eukprot:NODE_4599_length_1871_cov_3.062500.p1 GENE.NODE_4599_length_1871_cov_3.062500~~NODE_4599_length_1871_cov_3.062500.p1  ORF type:complete len:335 (-),score=104.25 NODE_4599_length_1871_cov_3.062500:784-1788(-)
MAAALRKRGVAALRLFASATTPPPPLTTPLIDIGANLLDAMYRGEYYGKPRHRGDLADVLRRAYRSGVVQVICTAGTLEDARGALELCRHSGEGWPTLHCTVGVHPTRCGEFDAAAGGAEVHLERLLAAARDGSHHVVAVGELGLDYARLKFCPREAQLRYCELQLAGLAAPLGLPLFLHCRTAEAARDLLRLLRRHRRGLADEPGVIHSFDGSLEHAHAFLDLGFHIGINGCSLRTAENLAVVRALPRERLLLETDSPWCAIRPKHAGHCFVQSRWEEAKRPKRWREGLCVRGRSEPCHLQQVLEVLAGCRGEDKEVLAESILVASRRVFQLT